MVRGDNEEEKEPDLPGEGEDSQHPQDRAVGVRQGLVNSQYQSSTVQRSENMKRAGRALHKFYAKAAGRQR